MKKKILFIIVMFVFPLTVTIAEVNYSLLYKYLNDVRTEAGVPRVDVNGDLVDLAKLQADAIAQADTHEHYMYDPHKGESHIRSIAKDFDAEKHYIDLRISELYAIRNKAGIRDVELELAHAFSYSSTHYTDLITFNVEAIGVYVAETEHQYFMVVYLLMRYYV